MHEETWWEGPLCVAHPTNGRRIVGICHDDQWRWTVVINGPAWQDIRLYVMAYAGTTVEQARGLATKLGPMREQDETEIARELLSQLEAARNSS